MTSREITGVALKVFAIYVLVQAVFSVPLLIQTYFMFNANSVPTSEAIWLWGLGGLSVVVLVCIFALLYMLSNKVVNEIKTPPHESDTIEMNEAFLLSVFGLYLLFEGVLKFGVNCVSAYILINNQTTQQEYPVQSIAYIIGYLIQVIIGLTLILKSNRWSAILRGLREIGLEGKPSNKAN